MTALPQAPRTAAMMSIRAKRRILTYTVARSMPSPHKVARYRAAKGEAGFAPALHCSAFHAWRKEAGFAPPVDPPAGSGLVGALGAPEGHLTAPRHSLRLDPP